MKELVQVHGAGVVKESRRMKGLLLDNCRYGRDVRLLLQALEAGVPVQLLEQKGTAPEGALLSNLRKRLHEDYGMDQRLARWAVESWAVALGFDLSKEKEPDPPPHPRREKEPDPPPKRLFNWLVDCGKYCLSALATISNLKRRAIRYRRSYSFYLWKDSLINLIIVIILAFILTAIISGCIRWVNPTIDVDWFYAEFLILGLILIFWFLPYNIKGWIVIIMFIPIIIWVGNKIIDSNFFLIYQSNKANSWIRSQARIVPSVILDEYKNGERVSHIYKPAAQRFRGENLSEDVMITEPPDGYYIGLRVLFYKYPVEIWVDGEYHKTVKKPFSLVSNERMILNFRNTKERISGVVVWGWAQNTPKDLLSLESS